MISPGCVVATIAAFVFSAASEGAPFNAGDFITYSQDAWVVSPARDILVPNFDALYTGGLELGLPGNAGYSMIFTGAIELLNYIPEGGPIGRLTSDLVNPTSTPSGSYGGEVTAVQLNVDFADAGLITGAAGIRFGDLILFNVPQPLFEGLSVRQFLGQANAFLGGAPLPGGGLPPYNEDAIYSLTLDLSRAFEGGVPSQFAQDHLRVGAAAVPEPTTMTLVGGAGLVLLLFRTRRKQQKRNRAFLPSTPMHENSQ